MNAEEARALSKNHPELQNLRAKVDEEILESAKKGDMVAIYYLECTSSYVHELTALLREDGFKVKGIVEGEYVRLVISWA